MASFQNKLGKLVMEWLIILGLLQQEMMDVVWLLGWLVFNGTFNTKRLYCAMDLWKILYTVHLGTNIQKNN